MAYEGNRTWEELEGGEINEKLDIRRCYDSIKARIKALENNIDDAEVHKVYKSANKDEINWLKYQLQEIELMLKDNTKEYDILYEAMNDNIPYLGVI